MTERILSEAYEFKRIDRQAAEHLAQAFANINDQKSAAAIRLASKEKGWHGVAEWMLNRQLDALRKKKVSPWGVARWYADLRRRDETLAALEDADNQHNDLACVSSERTCLRFPAFGPALSCARKDNWPATGVLRGGWAGGIRSLNYMDSSHLELRV